MDDAARTEVADALLAAQRDRAPCPPPSQTHPGLTVEDAYAVQRINIGRRLEGTLGGRPAKVVGHKVGITSKAIQSWLEVDQPDFGHLLDEMWIEDDGEVDAASLCQPRIEGEVAFVLGRELAGPGLTTAQVARAVDHVCASLEIIDSRVADWKIAYADTISDNASSALFVLGGAPKRLWDVDLSLAGMAMRKNGRVVSTGAGAACLGHPLNAVVWLANTLGRLGEKLEPGHVVLSGALGPVTELAAGDVVDLDIAHLGSTKVSFA